MTSLYTLYFDTEYLRAAADMVDLQSSQNPTLGIPVNREVAEFMGAFDDPAVDDPAEEEAQLAAMAEDLNNDELF